MTATSPKKYPHATDELAKILGFSPQDSKANLGMPSDSKTSPGPANLPIAETQAEVKSPDVLDHIEAFASNAASSVGLSPANAGPSEDIIAEKQPGVWKKIFKAVLPYAAVFAVGLFLYYFFFSTVNFSSIFKPRNQVAKVETPKENAIVKLEKQNAAAYNKWIGTFYFDVSDPKVLDPETDNSGNGLSNFQKFLLNLNPKSYDTLGLGMADSQALTAGINPLTGNALTDAQKEIIAEYFDMEVIMNRLALSNLHNSQNVAGVTTNSTGNNPSTSSGPSGNNTGYSGFLQTRPQIRPGATTSYTQFIPPVIAPATPNININDIDINTEIAGRLEIPALKINVPIIWTKDPKNFETDLKSGVVHYPGTALPGQIGTTYISGHSSNYAWAAGNFNKVFSKLGDLPDNTSFKVTVVQKNGKDARLHYVVTHRQEYTPTDQEQFRNTGKSVVALSTCWPVGSTAKRLVVFGELTQIEK